MPGQPILTKLVQYIPVGFFASYALLAIIQFPISAQFAMTLTFYALLLPSAILYAFTNPQQIKSVFKDPLVKAFSVLFAYILMHTLVLTQDHAGMGKTLLNTLETAFFALCSVVFFRDADAKFQRLFFRLMSYVAGVSAMVSIAMYYAAPELAERLVPIGRAHHEILGALSYGVAGIMAVYLSTTERLKTERWLHFASLLAITAMIVLTRSRMPLAAYVFCIVLAYGFYWKTPHKCLVLCAGAVGTLAVLALFPGLRLYCLEYISYAVAKKDGFRFELWQAASEKIVEHPWVGNGMRAMLEGAMTYSPHNMYLATAYYIGIPAALWFVGSLLACLVSAVRLMFSNNPVHIMASLTLFQGAISALTEHGQLVKSPGPLWLIFWMPVAFVIARSIKAPCESNKY